MDFDPRDLVLLTIFIRISDLLLTPDPLDWMSDPEFYEATLTDKLKIGQK